MCVPVFVSDNVAEITDVANLRVGATVGLSVGVEVGSSSFASLNQVT